MDTIHQHIVKRVGGQKRKVGVMFGCLNADGDIRIGWSRANISAGDKFKPDHGLKLAIERTCASKFVPAPPSILADLLMFQARCVRYFKGAGDVINISIQQEGRWEYRDDSLVTKV